MTAGKGWCPRHGMIDWDGSWSCPKCIAEDAAFKRLAEDLYNEVLEYKRRRSILGRLKRLISWLNPWKSRK